MTFERATGTEQQQQMMMMQKPALCAAAVATAAVTKPWRSNPYQREQYACGADEAALASAAAEHSWQLEGWVRREFVVPRAPEHDPRAVPEDAVEVLVGQLPAGATREYVTALLRVLVPGARVYGFDAVVSGGMQAGLVRVLLRASTLAALEERLQSVRVMADTGVAWVAATAEEQLVMQRYCAAMRLRSIPRPHLLASHWITLERAKKPRMLVMCRRA